jgi:hypothetical protein
MFQGVERPRETFFYILVFAKSELDEIAYVAFSVGEWPWDIIICLLGDLKNDFVEFDETMLQGVEGSCELIFCIMGIEKSDLEKFA